MGERNSHLLEPRRRSVLEAALESVGAEGSVGKKASLSSDLPH